MTVMIALAIGTVAGYLIRCWRPARRVVRWAQGQEAGTTAWWPAQPVLAAAVTVLFVVHPRRSVRNVRSWRQEQRVETPRRDPEWVAKRRAS